MPPATPRTTARRKTATAKPAPKKPTAASPDPVPPVPGEELPDVISLTTSEDEPDEMVPIFEIDGVTYSIVANRNARVVINAMWASLDKSKESMVLKFLNKTLGDEAFTALLDYKDVDFNILVQVMDKITAVTAGKTKDGDDQGNP